MTNIKLIWYDFHSVSSAQLDRRLQEISTGMHRINDSMILVNYGGSSRELFSDCVNIFGEGPVLITDIDDYWGYLDGDIWSWISSNLVRNR